MSILRRLFNGIPSAFLLAMVATFLFVNCDKEAVYGMAIATLLWAFHFYVARPVPLPPAQDEARVVALEEQVKDLNRQLESVRAAVNMRQLR